MMCLNHGQSTKTTTALVKQSAFKNTMRLMEPSPMSSLKMTAFGLKTIMMDLMKTQKPTLFLWPKAMYLG